MKCLLWIKCKYEYDLFRITIERSQSHGWLFDEDHDLLHKLRENVQKQVYIFTSYKMVPSLLCVWVSKESI